MIRSGDIALDPGHDARYTAIRVLHDTRPIGTMNVRHRTVAGRKLGIVKESHRTVQGVAPGAMSIAYGLLVAEGVYDVLRSDDELSADAVRLWENLRPPPGLSVFKCRNRAGEDLLRSDQEHPRAQRPDVVPTSPQPFFWCMAATEELVFEVFKGLAPGEVQRVR